MKFKSLEEIWEEQKELERQGWRWELVPPPNFTEAICNKDCDNCISVCSKRFDDNLLYHGNPTAESYTTSKQ